MWDSLIIGSGPAGLGAAIYGKRAGLSVLVAEKEYMGTGQIAESGQVDNYLGLVGKNGYDLGEILGSNGSIWRCLELGSLSDRIPLCGGPIDVCGGCE